ncbi:MAG TPA: alginate lyase family protein [Anaerolineaceae bacterium]
MPEISRKTLNLIAPYALPAAKDSPPEILPWNSTDPWGLENAARRTLGLLLEGEQAGERLYALADYLLTFITPADRWIPQPDALLYNGTALALCGYLCAGQHREAVLWRQTGAARLATAAHARRAALEDRPLAACLQAVCLAADELNAPILSDLITLRERMWGRLLDHARAERLHVTEADYPGEMSHPVAVSELGALVRNRPWMAKGVTPEYLMDVDLEEAEQTCRNLLTFRAHMLVRHQFGSEIDWHLQLFEDKESTVSINGMHPVVNLAYAFVQTGKQQYADQAARLLWSFYNQCPMPNHRQIVGPWRTLEVGSRNWRVFSDLLGYLGQNPAFDEATHAMLARNRLEGIRYLLAYCGGPNNWYQVESSGLAVAALYSPELALADAYLRIALRRLKWINSFAYYDDGFQFELTQGYHVFPTQAILSVVKAARARGVTLPADYVALVEKAHEMYQFSVQPNHLLPMFNDCNPNPTDPAPYLRYAAGLFNRADFRWGGSHGREGTAPDHTSHAWASAGYYVMRDRWGEDGQFLFFDGAPWGAAHQHEDKLNFVLYSHRRPLITDPNIYSYSPTELTHYFKSSRGHNLIMIDGMGQARRFNPLAQFKTEGRNEWVSQPEFDFVASEYLEGYAPDPYPERGDASQVVQGFTHRRAIFYVKPGYWILSDMVRGQDANPHRLEQIFHIAPIFDRTAAEPLRAGELFTSPGLVETRDAGMGNLALVPVDTEGQTVRAQKGETSPAVGWVGVLGEFPAWDVTFERHTLLPTRMDVVMFPLAPGEQSSLKVTRLRSDEMVSAFRIQGAGLDDLFILCEDGAGAVTVDGVTFEGRALFLRRLPERKVLSVGLVRLEA